ncbi:MAG: FAD-binding protein [Candidatus Altiarchaeota archaeon]|nr:FAD-binding protein [Candidatus Altiarchaeota archaeon]
MIDDLIGIFGRENVGVDEKDILAYSYDASDVEGRPLAVVWPKSAKQVSRLMDYSVKNVIPVFPRGAGTNLSGGAVPFKGIVVDFSRMNNIISISGGSVVVEPGVVLEDLEKELNGRGMTLPVLPASDKACTVGGCVAEDSAGMRAIKYGTMRDWVLGLEVVLPDGRIIETSDLSFVGSEGVICLITKATLKIAPKPEARSLTVVEVGTFREVQEKLFYYLDKKASSIELVSARINHIIKRPLGSRNTIVVEFEDASGDITDPREVSRITEHRKTISSQLASEGYVMVEDPRVPLEKTAEFLEEIDRLGIPCYGHLGYGVLHPRFMNVSDRRRIADVVLKVGANPVGEHGIGVLKKALKTKDWLVPLKREYDPKNVLNPGKVFPGGVVPDVQEVRTCVLCGMCRSRCPVFKALLTESVSPRGMAIFIEKGLKDTVFWEKCSQCRACDGVCPMSAELSRKIRDRREQLIKEGVETPGNRVMMENVRKYGNPFGKTAEGKGPKELYCC